MNTVTIYTTPTCHFCHAAKEFFAANAIEFTEKDVSASKENADEMISKSGQMGVPVIFVGEELVVGFDQPRLRELLKM